VSPDLITLAGNAPICRPAPSYAFPPPKRKIVTDAAPVEIDMHPLFVASVLCVLGALGLPALMRLRHRAVRP